MSTILKALRQLEHDKASSGTDSNSDLPLDPAAHPQSRPPHRRKRRPAWLGAGMAVAGLSLLVVAMYPTLEAWFAGPEVAVVRAPVPAPEAPAPAPEAYPLVREAPASIPEAAPVAQAVPAVPPNPDAAPAAPVALIAKPMEDVADADADPAGVAGVARAATPRVVAPPGVEAIAAPVPEEAPAPRAQPKAVAADVAGDEPAGSAGETVLASSPSPSPSATPAPVRTGKVPDAVPLDRALAGQRPPKRIATGVVLSNEDLTAARSDAVERAQELVAGATVSVAEPAPSAAEVPVEREQLARAEVPLAPPPLGIVRTSWHPTPERREANVSIDGTSRLIRQGDTALGYRVVEITPSSVVFGRGEETVRVRVGAR